eukprot:364697-Chlamydomonas_euryale.AAC.7
MNACEGASGGARDAAATAVGSRRTSSSSSSSSSCGSRSRHGKAVRAAPQQATRRRRRRRCRRRARACTFPTASGSAIVAVDPARLHGDDCRTPRPTPRPNSVARPCRRPPLNPGVPTRPGLVTERDTERSPPGQGSATTDPRCPAQPLQPDSNHAARLAPPCSLVGSELAALPARLQDTRGCREASVLSIRASVRARRPKGLLLLARSVTRTVWHCPTAFAVPTGCSNY